MKTSTVVLALAAALFAALAFTPTAAQGGMTLTIPGIIQPDIQAALGRARSENALPAVSAPPGASGSQSNQSKPVSSSNSNATMTASGGRKLLAQSCFYTGFAGSQFLFNFDVCPYTEGGRGSRCCDRGSNYGKCIPGNLFCICGAF